MKETGNVVIVLARCRQSRELFGVRFEKLGDGLWVGNWAFSIKESVAKKEGYDRSLIEGSFAIDSTYPGCPHCRTKGLLQCQCGKLACYDGESQVVTCPWCRAKGKVGGTVTRLEAGKDH